MNYVLWLLVGAMVGCLSGFTGLGGGILLVPILVYGFKFSQHTAQGTSLATLLLPIGLLAVARYWQAGHVKIWLALTLATGFLFGAYFGAHFAHEVPTRTLQRVFGVILIGVGLTFVAKR